MPCSTAALKLGSYIAGAGLDEQKVIAALEDAADHQRLHRRGRGDEHRRDGT